jgi:hypothetical protein
MRTGRLADGERLLIGSPQRVARCRASHTRHNASGKIWRKTWLIES